MSWFSKLKRRVSSFFRENFSQTSAVGGQISSDIGRDNQAVDQISQGSRLVQTNSDDMERMAGELNSIVGSFKV